MRNFNEIFRNGVTYDNIENHRKKGLQLSTVENHSGRGSNESPRLSTVNISDKVEIQIISMNRKLTKLFLKVFLRKKELFQPARDVSGTSHEGPLKVIMFETSRGPSGHS